MSESSFVAPTGTSWIVAPESALVLSDRLAIRYALLRRALRAHDVTATARALSRLRVRGATIDPTELAMAHGTRAAMGRAIRLARERRSSGELVEATGASATALALPVRIPGAWRVPGIAIAFAAIVIALLPAVRTFAPPVAPAEARSGTPAVSTGLGASGALSGGRGRTEVTPAPLAVATPAPAAAPTASAIPAPSAPPTVTSGPPPSPSPSLPPAPVALPSPSATATPSASLLPPPLVSGFSRIRVLVVDATTFAPIPGACIVIGSPDCGPTRPHTNALGLWWVDFPTGSIAGGQFPVTIQKDGYQSLSVVVATTGNDQDFPAPLTPLR